MPIACAGPGASSHWARELALPALFFFVFEDCRECICFGTTMGTTLSDDRTVPSLVMVCVATTSKMPLTAFGTIISLHGTIGHNIASGEYV